MKYGNIVSRGRYLLENKVTEKTVSWYKYYDYEGEDSKSSAEFIDTAICITIIC